MKYHPIVVHRSIFGYEHVFWEGKPQRRPIAIVFAKLMDWFITPKTIIGVKLEYTGE